MIEKIVQNNIPESWMEKFELLDRPKASTLRAVQLTLQKIEHCENLDNQTKSEKSEKNGKKKNSKKTTRIQNILILVENLDTTTNGKTVQKIGKTRKIVTRRNKK